MKKFVAILLAALMMLTFASCADKTTDDANDTTVNEETKAENNEVVAEGALGVVEAIWGQYAEEEKFPCGGGDSENMNFEGPAAFNVANTEELDATLGLPASLATEITDAASFMHMMNANTFTGACYTVKEGTDVAAFAETLKTNILARRWMCGIPETLVIINVDGENVISAFGANDIIETLKTNTTKAFADATVVVETAVVE